VAEVAARSSISVGLDSNGAQSVGSLFIYSRQVQAFDEEGVAAAQILAAHAAITVGHVRRCNNVERAIDTRTRTGQATGIVMDRSAVTAEPAFVALVRCSQAGSVKLRGIAAGVVRDGDLPTQGPSPVNATVA
jgi:GAF domain-containing protein